jgi:UDP-N-acetylmuramoyl-tripeptide--D-alanyl-D-alanine ligase
VCGIAFVWRVLLYRTTFIAVTGSVGKTTAKECLSAILSPYPVVATIGNSNGRRGVPRTILRTRPWHRFSIVEVGTDRPGTMIRSGSLVRPDIVVILSVARTHTNEFKTLEETAKEKAQLLRFLPRRGAAVLNGDDPRVAAMAKGVGCRIVWFGSSPEFDIHAREARADWPSRLEFTVSSPDESHSVRTQLIGTHWVPSVLAALATAHACDVSLGDAVRAVEDVHPFPGRMQPCSFHDGAILLRDEYNGSIDTLIPAFEVMRRATAQRRVAVISDCSDLKKKPRERLKYLAKTASQWAEMVVFVGERASYGAQYAATAGMKPENVHHFVNWWDAAAFLRKELQAGDLVLLKGRASHHLSRIYLEEVGTVKCRLVECSSQALCDNCRHLGFRPSQLVRARTLAASLENCTMKK